MRSLWRHPYVRAGAALTLVMAVKMALPDSLGKDAPFALFGLGVLASGWLGGAACAVVATGVMIPVIWYFFLPSTALQSANPAILLTLTAFAAEGLAMSAIVGVMERARAQEASAVQRLERQQALTAALAAARTLAEVTDVVVRQAVQTWGAVTAVLMLPREDGRLELSAQMGLEESTRAAYATLAPDAPDPIAKAFRLGEPEWIPDVDAVRAVYPHLATPGAHAGTGLVSLPLVVDGRVLGMMAYRFNSPTPFAPAERRLISTFVVQAAQVLDRALTFAREASARQRLESLANLNAALSTTRTRAEVANVVVGRGTAAMGADTCTLFMTDEKGGSLDLIGDVGVSPTVLDQIRSIPITSNSPSALPLRTGLPIWAETEEDYHRYYPALASLNAPGPRARAFWSFPLIVEGRPIGLLGMGFYAPRRFSPDDRSFVETFVGYCGQVLRRAQQFESEMMQRQTAEQARASLSTTLRSIGDAVIATDTAKRIVFMNPVAEELTGWQEATALGQPLADVFRIVNEQTRLEVESPAERVLREGVVVGLANHTVLLGRAPGQETPIDDSGAPIRDDSGRIRGVVLVFRDVTLKKDEESRRSFLSDAVTELSSSLDFQTTLARVAALSVPRLADWCAVEIVTPEGGSEQLAVAHVDPAKVAFAWDLRRRYPTDPNARTGIPNVLRTGKTEVYTEISDEMLRLGAKDEEHLAITRGLGLRSVIIAPMTSRNRVLGAITFVSSTSGRQFGAADVALAEELASRAALAVENSGLYREAQLAVRKRDDFLSVASHELKTPLTTLRLQVDGLLRAAEKRRLDALPVETQLDRLRKIGNQADRMTTLVNQLLDVSRVSSGHLDLRPSPLILGELLTEVTARFQEQAEQAGSPLTLVIRGDTGGEWERERLDQVATNLISNAIKYGRGKPVEVMAASEPGWVRFSVTDHGVGIAAEDQARIFQMFERTESARNFPGLGLGLWISKQIVEAHGGTLSVSSEPGTGSTFTVALPVHSTGSGS